MNNLQFPFKKNWITIWSLWKFCTLMSRIVGCISHILKIVFTNTNIQELTFFHPTNELEFLKFKNSHELLRETHTSTKKVIAHYRTREIVPPWEQLQLPSSSSFILFRFLPSLFSIIFRNLSFWVFIFLFFWVPDTLWPILPLWTFAKRLFHHSLKISISRSNTGYWCSAMSVVKCQRRFETPISLFHFFVLVINYQYLALGRWG